MTDQKLINRIQAAPTAELFENLEYYGCDPYYKDLWSECRAELQRRFSQTVIRCQDCKWFHKVWHSDKRLKEKGYYCVWCDHECICCQEGGYCSEAELKDSEEAEDAM